jgi:TPR repeat protein
LRLFFTHQPGLVYTVRTRETSFRKQLGFLFFGACLCGFTQIAQAESDYKLGVQAYQDQEFEQARRYWEDSTADGNISASFNLALLLSKGIGGPADTARAVNLFRRVADEGLAVGQHNLALAYYSGKGVTKDKEQARIWWERAALQGHAQAQFNLGALLWNGDGVHKDTDAAIKWIRKSSDAGNTQALAFLNTILAQQDAKQPTQPLETPNTDLDPTINTLLERAASAYQLQEYDSAYSHWKKAADLNNAIAQYQLSRLYREGWGVDQDLPRAYHFTQLSAKQNLSHAQYQLALYYIEGEQVGKNETLALYWMQLAADQGHLIAKDHLERLR